MHHDLFTVDTDLNATRVTWKHNSIDLHKLPKIARHWSGEDAVNWMLDNGYTHIVNTTVPHPQVIALSHLAEVWAYFRHLV